MAWKGKDNAKVTPDFGRRAAILQHCDQLEDKERAHW